MFHFRCYQVRNPFILTLRFYGTVINGVIRNGVRGLGFAVRFVSRANVRFGFRFLECLSTSGTFLVSCLSAIRALRIRGVLIGILMLRVIVVVLNTVFIFILCLIVTLACLPTTALAAFVRLSASTWVKMRHPTFIWGSPRETGIFIWSYLLHPQLSWETLLERRFDPRNHSFTFRRKSSAQLVLGFGLHSSYNWRFDAQSQPAGLSGIRFKVTGVRSPWSGKLLRSPNGIPWSIFCSWGDSWCETWVVAGVLADCILLVNSCCSDGPTAVISTFVVEKRGDLLSTFSRE